MVIACLLLSCRLLRVPTRRYRRGFCSGRTRTVMTRAHLSHEEGPERLFPTSFPLQCAGGRGPLTGTQHGEGDLPDLLPGPCAPIAHDFHAGTHERKAKGTLQGIPHGRSTQPGALWRHHLRSPPPACLLPGNFLSLALQPPPVLGDLYASCEFPLSRERG